MSKGGLRETVIVVHGTWAAPQSGKTPWYHPVSASAPEGFISKLDAALQKRGSTARCWAHCPPHPTFQWSGENSWIARTQAAFVLREYVEKLQAQGWRCHLIGHSHGGNIVSEALPHIIATLIPGLSPGRIVTLGTPFADAMSDILRRADRVARILKLASDLCLIIAAAALFLIGIFFWHPLVFLMTFITWAYLRAQSRRKTDEIRRRQTNSERISRIGEAGGMILAINSPMDEAWQLLHHIRNTENPIAVRSNLLSYIFSSLKSQVSQLEKIARIQGAKTYFDPDSADKRTMYFFVNLTFIALVFIIGLMIREWASYDLSQPHTMPIEEFARAFILFVGGCIGLILIIILGSRQILGDVFYSAILMPLRWCWCRLSCLRNLPNIIATYQVRRSAWSVIQAMTMGFEGYQFKLPVIEKYPRSLPSDLVKYEDMPKESEVHALAMRADWVSRNLGRVSETFSNEVVTQVDVSLLLRKIEADQSLVHAAYYIDDECIARIASWIAEES